MVVHGAYLHPDVEFIVSQTDEKLNYLVLSHYQNNCS